MENNAKPVSGLKAMFIKHLFAMQKALAMIFVIVTFPLFLFLKGLVYLLRLLNR
jgi:hypothetical protein